MEFKIIKPLFQFFYFLPQTDTNQHEQQEAPGVKVRVVRAA